MLKGRDLTLSLLRTSPLQHGERGLTSTCLLELLAANWDMQWIGCWFPVPSLHLLLQLPVGELWGREIPFAWCFWWHMRKKPEVTFRFLWAANEKAKPAVETDLPCLWGAGNQGGQEELLSYSTGVKLLCFKGCQEREGVGTWRDDAFSSLCVKRGGNDSRASFKNCYVWHWEHQFTIRYIAGEVSDH